MTYTGVIRSTCNRAAGTSPGSDPSVATTGSSEPEVSTITPSASPPSASSVNQ